jgi:6-phosphogluconolactonase (cycloisomerase 2 family)
MTTRAAVRAGALAIIVAGALMAAYGSAAPDVAARDLCFVITSSPPSISTLTADLASGALRSTGRTSAGASGDHLSALAVHPSGKFLYAAASGRNGSKVLAFAIDGARAAPKPIAGPSNRVEPIPVAAAFDHRGRFLYLASQNPAGNHAALSVFAIDARTGNPAPVTGSPFGAGFCVTDIAIDPSDRFLYMTGCANFGKLGTLPSVLGFRIDAATGALTPMANSPFGVGTSEVNRAPGGIAIDPSGKHVYAADVLGSSIWVFNRNPADGTLAPLASAPFLTGTPGHATRPSALAAGAAGRYLYAAVKPPSSHAADETAGVFGFAVEPAAGTLKPLAGQPVKAGDDPAALAIDPAGKILYVADGRDSSIAAFRIAPDGVLSALKGSPLALGTGNVGGARGPSQIAVVEIH